jgi:hypothetical protein
MQPDRIQVGSSVILISVSGLARYWGVSEKSVTALLATFSIPTIRFPGGEKRYVSLYSLEMALFVAGLPQTEKVTPTLRDAHLQLAGVLYGTLSKEVIHDRVRKLALAVREGPARKKRAKAKAKSRLEGYKEY